MKSSELIDENLSDQDFEPCVKTVVLEFFFPLPHSRPIIKAQTLIATLSSSFFYNRMWLRLRFSCSLLLHYSLSECGYILHTSTTSIADLADG